MIRGAIERVFESDFFQIQNALLFVQSQLSDFLGLLLYLLDGLFDPEIELMPEDLEMMLGVVNSIHIQVSEATPVEAGKTEMNAFGRRGLPETESTFFLVDELSLEGNLGNVEVCEVVAHY